MYPPMIFMLHQKVAYAEILQNYKQMILNSSLVVEKSHTDIVVGRGIGNLWTSQQNLLFSSFYLCFSKHHFEEFALIHNKIGCIYLHILLSLYSVL